MPSPDEYREHSAKCVGLAQRTENEADQAFLLSMANSWLKLAELHEEAARREEGDDDKTAGPRDLN
jgi:hypothetical protein